MSSHRSAIDKVLAGSDPYDLLGQDDQVLVREEWARRAAAVRCQLDYAAEFGAAGERCAEIDDAGNVVDPAVNGRAADDQSWLKSTT
ncbi:hypothetical protein [Nakamurella alba]|uniref:hypothetical protein n=1 Tax=Nakamurella alba TaxID=2665158 RepID=UPI001E4D8A2B|nr:hypothetical protein [Nakamurella alba]